MAQGFLISCVWDRELDGASPGRKQRGDYRDRSIRAALPATLLVEWSFGGSRLFVTQNTQRQLLLSGDGFNCHSQYS